MTTLFIAVHDHSTLAVSIAYLGLTLFSPQVNYKKNMPDIELLMEAWPPEFEEIVGNVNLLTPELDMPLEDYARMVGGIRRIPCELSSRLCTDA